VRPGRWQMAAFPLRIKDGDAGVTRAVLWNS
jgi:kynurenine formamidase